jgi:hypothetical protein
MIQKPFFLRQVQFLKAGAMGVVFAVSFFCNARPAQKYRYTAVTEVKRPKF